MTASHILKQRGEAFVMGLAAGSLDPALVDPNMTIWASSRSEPLNFAKLQGAVALLASLFDGDLAMTIESTICEGNRVAIQAHSKGMLKDGPVYENSYHYAVKFNGDRIIEVREYMNSAVVKELILPRLAKVTTAV